MALNKVDEIDFFERKTHRRFSPRPYAHYHDKHELYYLAKGQAKYFVGNDIFMLEPGDMIFVPKGVVHRADYGESQNVERVLFSFDDELIDEENSEYISYLKENKYVRISQENQYELKNIFLAIEKETEREQSGYRKMQRLYFDQLLILISRYSHKGRGTHLSESYIVVQNAAKYISENYNEDLRLEGLAEKYYMSPWHFSRLFKSVTGMGLNEYINIARIRAAEQLLSQTDLPITAVAAECGFNDSNYFSNVFKKIKGITPKKYQLARK
ncbi:MAG: AraC family transcriptional regulator [Clostridia bacterium]|nr:AraC family transcriptional regulator [Clostridia bacterium]